MTKQSSISHPTTSNAKKSGSTSARPGISPQTPAAFDVQAITPAHVMQLQRAIGNQAVARLLAKDKPTPRVQRASEAPLVGSEGGAIDGDVEATIRSQTSQGSPLPQTIRRTLEPHLGRDLSQARTHTDPTSARLNKQLGAKAFTYGNNIFYGAGHSPSDIQLTAHEATHFVQQQNPAAIGESPVRRSVDPSAVTKTAALSSVQPRIQRDKEMVSLNGKTKSIEKDNKAALKTAITDLSMQGVKRVSSKAKPEAVMLMGAPGSGKSSILDEVVPDRSRFVHADPDAVKAAMPAYQAGIKQGNANIATTVHAESKDITKSVVSTAINTRRNLLYDGTGGNKQEYDGMITDLRTAGYGIKLVMTHISVTEGLKRVAERAAITGRSIPDSVVKDIYQWVPRNFPDLVNKVDQALLFDNMVPKGQPPKLIWEKGSGTTLSDNQITNLKGVLTSIGAKQMDDNTDAPDAPDEEEAVEEEVRDREHLPLEAHRRYLQDGGTSRWMDDAGSTKYGFSTSRNAISQIDTNLKLYRQYKSKSRGNAEEQGKLLLGMKSALANSKYQGDSDKNTKTFIRRRQATTMLSQEVKDEIRTNPQRLMKIASQGEQVKELVRVGFSTEFLGKILKRDLKLLYEAHTALSHHQTAIAQRAFDELNPVEREDDGNLKYSGDYIKRSRDTFHFAQQIMSSHHHQAIGGEYGRTFAKPEPMDDTRMQKVTDKYVRNKDFIGAGLLSSVRNSNLATKTLDQLVTDLPELSSQEIEAIRIYTGSKYKQMNATMHDIRMDDPKQQKGFKGYSAINQLAVSGLNKLPSYKGTYTYRGDNNFGGLADTARAGTVFKAPSFMSTSKKPGVAGMFGSNVAWAVKLASPSRGKDLEDISVANMEYEVLFPPGTKMKVLDVFRQQPNAPGPDNETQKQRMKRLWKSDKGKSMTKEVYDFASNLGGRQALIVLQEMG